MMRSDLVERLKARAVSYRMSGPSAEHTAALLDEAAALILFLEARATRAEEIKSRLADNEKLEWFVFEIFYANPIAFARKNLVIALQRYLLGLPLKTPEEEQIEYLDTLSDEDRAAWWRAENAKRLTIRSIDL